MYTCSVLVIDGNNVSFTLLVVVVLALHLTCNMQCTTSCLINTIKQSACFHFELAMINKQEKTLVDELISYNCNAQTEYNEVASLIFTDADTAIRQLFHFRYCTYIYCLLYNSICTYSI
jgi:hypothetical protein